MTSTSTLNISEKSTTILDFNLEERVKKLEEIFNSIKYISPTPYEYKIIINDEKIRNLSLSQFNIMSSLHYIFISLNNNLPVFRVNVDKCIKIKSFDKIIEGNQLIITINELDPKIVFDEKRKNIILKSFFNIVLKRIYNKYSYYNSKIFYINNLKKKCINYLKYYYLYSLREKQKHNKMKLYYYKVFINLLRENVKEKKREK